jgi:2-polyprenyl-6-methoxyphenol hydroxylase-like FAD-dependent oxidoreductase
MNNPSSNTHAIVIGGGIAGLLAVRILLLHFSHVTLIERDQFPEDPIFHAGVPQGHHPHILLEHGRQLLEELFPGITAKLIVQSAGEIDLVADSVLYTASQRVERFPSGIPSIACSRLLIEWQVRQELTHYAQLQLLEGQEVIGLLASSDRTVVNGVRMRERNGTIDTQAITELHADLVVDASGRYSHAPQWLEELGYAAPAETVINAFLGYASRYYAIPSDPARDWHSVTIQGSPRENRRGGIILPIEGDRWHVALAGMNKDYPPTQEDAFLEFAKSLPDSILYDAIKEAEPLSPIYGYRRTENRWRHFERLKRQPEGFVAIGDAVCAFNPIYGQGMSVAAMGAESLKKVLQRYPHDRTGFARAFHRELVHACELPWQLASSSDHRIVAAEGEKTPWVSRVLYRYIDSITALVPTDRKIHLAFLQLMHLQKSISVLFQPTIMLKVLAYNLGLFGEKREL